MWSCLERTISSTDKNKCKIPQASTWLRWFKGRELGEELQQWIWWKFRLCVHRGYYDTLGFYSECDEDFEQGSDIISHIHKELLWLLFSGASREARYKVITIIQMRNIWIVVSSKVAQLSPTLCNPMDCSLPGSSVHGIFQTRVLEWVAISFSRGSSRPRDGTRVSNIADRRFTVWATKSLSIWIVWTNSLDYCDSGRGRGKLLDGKDKQRGFADRGDLNAQDRKESR